MVKEGKASGEVMGAAERRIQKPCLQLEPALFTARATNRIALSCRTHCPAVAAAACADVNPASARRRCPHDGIF